MLDSSASSSWGHVAVTAGWRAVEEMSKVTYCKLSRAPRALRPVVSVASARPTPAPLDRLQREAVYAVGDVVTHRHFGYRGVVVDADPVYRGPADWYDTIAPSRPPRDRPWYRLLVHEQSFQTYAAESDLERDASGRPVVHPMLRTLFRGFQDGRYVSARTLN